MMKLCSLGLDSKTQEDCLSPFYLDGITIFQEIFHCSAEWFDEDVAKTTAPCCFVVLGTEMQLNWIIYSKFYLPNLDGVHQFCLPV